MKTCSIVSASCFSSRPGSTVLGAALIVLAASQPILAAAGDLAPDSAASPAVLTVKAAPPCVGAPGGLISWWRGEGDGSDFVGMNDGELRYGVGFGAGKVVQAFRFEGLGPRVAIADSESLQVTGSLTIECWIKPSEYRPGIIVMRGDNRPGLDPYLVSLQPDGGIAFVVGSAANEAAVLYSPAVGLGEWTHVAAVLEDESGAMKIYLNGVVAAEMVTPIRPFKELDAGSEPGVGIGNHGGSFHEFPYHGLIDEVGIYGRALNGEEVRGIYEAGAAGKCAVAVAPGIVTQPESVTVTEGGIVEFRVEARGTEPLRYQWWYGGAALAGATSPTLLLERVSVGQAGEYAVDVSNEAGSVRSSSAVLTVKAAPPCVGAPAGLISWWRGEGDGSDFVGMNNGELLYGVGFGAGKVGQAFRFEGLGPRVAIADSEGLQVTGSLTIECWIKPSEYRPGIIVMRGDNRPGLDPYVVSLQADGRITFVVGNAANEAAVLYSPAVGLGEWTHVAAVLEDESGAMKIYLNGVVAAEMATPIRPFKELDAGSEPGVGIGNHGGSFHEFPYHGLIDEVGIYGRGLNGEEVRGIYEAGVAGKCLAAPPPSLEELIVMVKESGLAERRIRPLLASLEAALRSFERGNTNSGENQVRAFIHKVEAQVRPDDPELAEAFIRAAEAILGAGSAPGPQISRVKPAGQGKVRLELTGRPNQECLIEASTDLIHWEVIGSVGASTTGSLEWEDEAVSPHRFYRLVQP